MKFQSAARRGLLGCSIVPEITSSQRSMARISRLSSEKMEISSPGRLRFPPAPTAQTQNWASRDSVNYDIGRARVVRTEHGCARKGLGVLRPTHHLHRPQHHRKAARALNRRSHHGPGALQKTLDPYESPGGHAAGVKPDFIGDFVKCLTQQALPAQFPSRFPLAENSANS